MLNFSGASNADTKIEVQLSDQALGPLVLWEQVGSQYTKLAADADVETLEYDLPGRTDDTWLAVETSASRPGGNPIHINIRLSQNGAPLDADVDRRPVDSDDGWVTFDRVVPNAAPGQVAFCLGVS